MSQSLPVYLTDTHRVLVEPYGYRITIQIALPIKGL